MSILIKGMAMPKGCNECAQFWCDHCRIHNTTVTLKRHEDCPLIEIPTPHGRLIDADDAMKHLADDGREAFTKYQVWLFFSKYGAPTILDAEA